ncbi:MAG: DUF4838 domain-containing protein [Victivallales bacterium]|nr:DUF4838 domain-containing protein [Victivallales bacterium]
MNNKITLPDNPKIYETEAAAQLEEYMPRLVGTLKVAGKKAHFFVGDTAEARKQGILCDKMDEEAWSITANEKGQIFLCGGGTRGTLYATTHFLEDKMGMHWLTPTDEYIPEKKATIDLEQFSLKGKPYFKIRDVYRAPKPAQDKGRFAMHLRLNLEGEWPLIDPKYGGGINYGSPSHCHTIETGYFPAKQYFKEHPEYYSLIDGKRNSSMWFGQICVSRPGLVEEFIEKLKAFILADEAEAAKTGQPAPWIYDISLNDSRGFCQCPECAERVKKYGESGAFLLVLNPIADALKKFRPNYVLQTLAYFATTEPPKGGIVAADNILVRTCNAATYLHEKIDSDLNDTFRKQVQGWAKVSNILCPWEYSITYGTSGGKLPYPSEFNIGENIRFYSKNKAIGMFFEHENPDSADMYDMKVYMEAKLLENPFQDEMALMQEFCHMFYGKAAPHILKYRQLLRDAAFKNNANVHFFFPFALDFRYIGWKEMVAMQQCIDEALKAVEGNELLTKRVAHAANTLDFALLCNLSWWYRLQAAQAGQAALHQQLFAKSNQRFFSTWEGFCAELKEKEGRNVSTKNRKGMERFKQKAAKKFRLLPQSKGQLALTPDIFATGDEGSRWIENSHVPAGVYLQVKPQFTKVSEGADPSAYASKDETQADMRKLLLEVRDYNSENLKDISLVKMTVDAKSLSPKDFTPVTIKNVPFRQGRPIFSICNRKTVNFRLDFLKDYFTEDTADITIYIRLKDKLELSHVVINQTQKH